jgi:predicted Fe-S protein YdhL (DUF1289 family)
MQTLYSDMKMRDKSRSRILSTAGRPALDIALRLIELCYGCRLFWRELPAWYLVSARAALAAQFTCSKSARAAKAQSAAPAAARLQSQSTRRAGQPGTIKIPSL